MARRPSTSGRLLWDGRLIDREGRLFGFDRQVDRAEISDLMLDSAVQIAVSACGGPLQWVEPAARLRVWREELDPNMHDVQHWKPPQRAPGQLPYVPELWTAATGDRLVLFNDRD